MRLDDYGCLVTGAGRGIGEAVAELLAAAGARLVLVSRTAGEVEQVAARLRAAGAEAVAVPGDVTRAADVDRAVATAVGRFGRLDAVVNAAGVYGPIGPLAENAMDEWGRAVEINLVGAARVIHRALAEMLARGAGSIVNFSGGGAVAPFPRFSAYSASKAAVVRLTETVAAEVAAGGVRVNAIAPGAVNTRLLDQVLEAGERAGADFYRKALEQRASGGTPPERAAELAVFLVSPASAGITGRLLSAVWDDWRSLAGRGGELGRSSLYTLRRIDGRHFTEVG
jgi:NAD(P)-dependent dehydrogenase (short-subunit alcohol dehydrogenase family)